MAENELVLIQRDSLGFGFQFKLIDGRQLQIFKKEKKSEKKYSIDILSLENKSKKTFSIAWKWLFSSVVFFLIMSAILKILPNYIAENKDIYLGVVWLIGIMGGLISLIKFWKCTSIKQVFYSRIAGVPIITLNAGKPSKDLFSTFVTGVEKRIMQFRKHMDIDEEKQLAGEMKMLRRLSDNNVISNKLYEKAKGKLLKGFKK